MSENDKQAPRWVAAPAEALVWANFGDAAIAYHRPSGKTHFLNRASHYLLTELLREPQDAATVVRAFSEGGEPGHGATAALDRELGALLEHLEQLGLIDRE